MDNWYVPITILPGIALLILSTSNMLIALSNEISKLIKENTNPDLTAKKLKQLSLLTKAMVGLYLAAGTMVIAGITAGIRNYITLIKGVATIFMLAGTISLFISIGLLITFSIHAVRIRHDQFDNIPH
ncbi:hypothetical protein [Leptobacterium sp. I13]|uniref:hypothetical protein n=1 Tax=Leptobacterium meishanense TaxID=3128904 RepID=UPI0030EF88B6